MNIKGKIVTLRAPEITDLRQLHQWSNDPEIWDMLGGWHFPFSSRSTEEWIKSREDNNLRDHVFCIDTPVHGFIGTANLVNIDWKNKNAFHGMMLGNIDVRGKGYALDAVMAIMRYAFDELGLERLDTDIIEYNGRSLKYYTEKCGWEIEGKRKSWYFRKGRFFDKIIVGITKSSYLEFVNNSGYWSANDKPQ
jgi:RimJ/RimL family protein N-acetyltransferase